MVPPARLDPWLPLAPCGRPAVRRLERGSRVSVDAQVDSVLVKRRDVVGGNEARAAGRANHKPVKDVLVKGRHDVVYRADLLAT